jgi:hypothetical protein
MAATELERRISIAESDLRAVQFEQIELDKEDARLDAKVDRVQIVAYLAAGAALLFGGVNFVLLCILIGRLS